MMYKARHLSPGPVRIPEFPKIEPGPGPEPGIPDRLSPDRGPPGPLPIPDFHLSETQKIFDPFV